MGNEEKQYFKQIKSPLELKNIEDKEERYKDYSSILDGEIKEQKKHISLGNIR